MAVDKVDDTTFLVLDASDPRNVVPTLAAVFAALRYFYHEDIIDLKGIAAGVVLGKIKVADKDYLPPKDERSVDLRMILRVDPLSIDSGKKEPDPEEDGTLN